MANSRKINDPHAEREAQKYENPIPSREVIMALLEEEEGPISYAELVAQLELNGDDNLEALRRRLKAMVRDGQLVRNRREGFGLASKMQVINGRVIGHADGFGFLVPDDGSDDLFLSGKQMRPLLHGDRAMVRVSGIDRRGRREGSVVEVLERANNDVVGRFNLEHGIGFVIPDNKRVTQDILIPADCRGGASNGQIVVAHIIEQPTNRSQPIGRVAEVLGDHMAAGMEIDIAIRAHELPREWSDEVREEIKEFSGEVADKDKEGREDLRDLPLVTIDGEDSRDFDDAVYCEPHGKGWRLLVAIADVSHYVKEGSALDVEAKNRGNSVYFPGRVIPMLPEVLSNGLCSLNPKVDRLCMVCEMLVTATGVVRKSRFFEGVMRSSARLTYTEMAAMVVDKDPELRNEHGAIIGALDELYSLYKVFREKRDKRGAIDFETTETRIVFGCDRKIERIVPVERNDAHKIIEEFMIAANVCTAKHLLEVDIPALYRVHNGPSEDKVSNLREFLAEVGLSLGGKDEPLPKHYAKLLSQIAERPDAHLIQTVLLRSLSQAVYTPDNSGHFGLSFDAYSHFTSPIRRYPDLLVHRALRHSIRIGSKSGFNYQMGDMLAFGEHCSMTERRADEATRDAMDWLKCEYMLERVGEEYEGIITSVTSFGMFVELNEIFVEGLVHITSLVSDYYDFDPVKHRLVGERSRRVYRLADKIKVRVVRVDLDRKRIDFELADAEEAGQSKSIGRRRRKPKSGEPKSEAKPIAKPKGKSGPKAKSSRKKRSRKKKVKRS
ncbi:ribonuclease R [Pseudomonadota bacterium]